MDVDGCVGKNVFFFSRNSNRKFLVLMDFFGLVLCENIVNCVES